MKYRLFGIFIFLLLWELIFRMRFLDPFFLPGPYQTLHALANLFLRERFLYDVLFTLQRTLISFIAAAFIGVPLGLVFGSMKKLYDMCEFIIDFFRSMPATAMFPLFLVIFGISDLSKIMVALFASALVVLFNTARGVINADTTKVAYARMSGASKMRIFQKVLFWESLPQTFIGLRTAISLCLIIIVVTEMFIGTDAGVGRRIIDFQITYEIPSLYAAILTAGIIGYSLNLGFSLFESRVIHWR